jgi:Ca-activated chloride channel family protein
MLFTLLLVPVILFLYSRVQKRRQRDFALLGVMGLVRDGSAKPPGRKRHIPALIFVGGLSLLLFATARPQMVLALPQIEGIVMLAFDTSASMGADDMEPTRLGAAKLAANAFVERQPRNVKIGVVSFSDGGLVVQEPSNDHASITAAIERLVPQSGTSLGHGILAALLAELDEPESDQIVNRDAQSPPPAPRGAFAPRIIILLTDGENTAEPDPLEAAQIAIEQGVRVYAVGIGSSGGATLEIDGFNVFTQLDENTLQEISQITEGQYYSAESAEDLRAVYESLDPQFVVRPEKMEITSILGGISMLVLIIGGVISLLWFGRVP